MDEPLQMCRIAGLQEAKRVLDVLAARQAMKSVRTSASRASSWSRCVSESAKLAAFNEARLLLDALIHGYAEALPCR